MSMLTPEIVGLVKCTCGLWRRCMKECHMPNPPEYYKEVLEINQRLKSQNPDLSHPSSHTSPKESKL